MKVTYISETIEVQSVDTEGNLLFEEDGITPIMETQKTNTGPITGINRGPVGEEEDVLNFLTTEFVHGYIPEYYKIVNGDLLPLSTQEIESLKATKIFEDKKKKDKEEVRETFKVESDSPVEVNGILWTGGESSAAAINGAVTLAQALGETVVHITDYYNVSHEMSFEEAQYLAAMVALSWRTAFFKKQEALVEIDNRVEGV